MAAPKPPTTIEKIISLANRPDVSVFIDGDSESENARIGTTFTYEKKEKILTIILANIKAKDQDKLLPVIRQYFEETGLVLTDTQEEVLETYTSYAEDNPDKEILDFFADKLPHDDLSALKMSLFMRSEKDAGNDISAYKTDIRERFGARGTYIANLCNAGYFENEFMPLAKNSVPTQFRKKYEILVGEKARALFVHTGMTKGIIQDYFDAMVNKALKYQLTDFRIHGFGKQNVAIIEDFIANREKDEDEKFEIVQKDKRDIPPAIEYDVLF